MTRWEIIYQIGNFVGRQFITSNSCLSRQKIFRLCQVVYSWEGIILRVNSVK